MTACADPLISVGRDCDCGHPLVWRAGHQWCSVYGSHPPPAPVLYLRPAAFVLADIERRLRAVS